MKKTFTLLVSAGILIGGLFSCGKPYECVCHEGKENEYSFEIKNNNRTEAEFECAKHSNEKYNSLSTCEIKY